MKYFSKLILGIVGVAGFLAACDKADVVPTNQNGTTPTLSISNTTITVGVGDTTNVVANFAWTSPHYATDSSTVKYVLQIDTVGGNFSNPLTLTSSGNLNTSFTGNGIDSLLVNVYGLSPAIPYNMEARLISSYANNNEQFVSNTINATITLGIPPFPNVTAMPVDTPTTSQLWIIGDLDGWNNGGLAPQYQFTKVNSSYYTITTNMGGANTGYLFLQANDGDWSDANIYKNGTAPSTGGYFGASGGSFGNNFVAPTIPGTYMVRVRFDLGYFDVIKLTR